LINDVRQSRTNSIPWQCPALGGCMFFADARHAAVVPSLDSTLVHGGCRCVKLHPSKVIQFRGNLVLRSAQLCSHVPFIQSCTSHSFQVPKHPRPDRHDASRDSKKTVMLCCCAAARKGTLKGRTRHTVLFSTDCTATTAPQKPNLTNHPREQINLGIHSSEICEMKNDGDDTHSNHSRV